MRFCFLHISQSKQNPVTDGYFSKFIQERGITSDHQLGTIAESTKELGYSSVNVFYNSSQKEEYL